MSLLSPNGNPNSVQSSAIAAVTWVMYDVCLTWDRELSSVWRSPWSIPKILFIFSRYHTILALGFFLMEAIGTAHLTLRTGTGGPLPTDPGFWAPCRANLPYSYVSRWYLGLTEVLSIMSGQFMILIRINAVYGWSRRVVLLTLFLFFAESVIGFTTTIISIRGGAKGLFDSTEILTCSAMQGYIPDVNVSRCTSMVVVGIYLILVVHKAKDIAHVIDGAESQLAIKKVGHLFVFQTTNMTPTLHVCLRDAAIYFGVIFGVLLINLVLVLVRDRNAYMGTAWLLATYSVASTRISLNLKDLSAGARYNESSWSKFQENSVLEFSEMQPVTTTVDVERPSEPPEAHVRARISIL
ncbi:hypothetical protein C8F04DRAFT_1079786 [Mycena alexandri]|uniref:DUF6533 domain-containing protein n=1 Tax=Mycena alexandri TaxID=1745969 RepID=A0AAD6XAX5_9AGAR|nr:hypothetical protein C8F04DRAFT_1079786 [Mycena alexandri]